jgi:predicted permease
MVEGIAQDVRFALRMLRKSPGFAAVAVIVLALGIGANGVIFSLINAVLLKPLNGGRIDAAIVGVYAGDRTRPDLFRRFSYPEFAELRSRNGVFADLVAEAPARLGVTEGGLTRRTSARYVSSNYFHAFGATPAMGRFFTAEEERPGNRAPVAVVSYGYWRKLGMPADIIGRSITVNARVVTIVGVAPDGFHGTTPVVSAELWLPLGAGEPLDLFLSASLRPGISGEAAQTQLAPLAAALEAEYPDTSRNLRLVVQPRSRVNFGGEPYTDAEPKLGAMVLMAIAGMVLVVACLNLANLQLARGSVRRREIAVRLALGGSRRRIVRQLLVEGAMLATVAGAAALGIAWWVAVRITSSVSSLLQRDVSIDVAPDARLLTLIAAASIVSAVVVCLGPALKLSRPDVVSALKQTGPLPAARRRLVSVPGLLVGVQVALSLALLVAAGVFARASLNAASGDPGFALEDGVLAEIDGGLAGLDEAETRALYSRVLDRLRSLPDVRAASAASIVPFGPMRDGRMVRRNGASVGATFTVIGSGYFETLGLRVLAGRDFTAVEEQRATEPVAIVDQALAARLFPGQSPLGELVQLSRFDAVESEALRIVGVVPSVRDDILGTDQEHVYVPFGRNFRTGMTFHVRTAPGREAATLARVREAVASVDARLPVLTVRTIAALRDDHPSLFAVRLGSLLFAAFGVIALLLSAAGLYGLRAYLVTQRTRELGIRMALGATRGGVVGQLLKEAAATAAFGVAAGFAVALGLVQVLRQSEMLYRVSAVDPLVFTVAPLVLVAAITLASYIPALRALRIDPAVALRPE